MKLTEQKLRQIIREIIEEGGFYGGTMGQPDPDIGKHHDPYKKSSGKGMKAFGPGYSSKEAKSIMEKSIKDYVTILRKAEYKIIKDWLNKAKAGMIDYFDVSTILRSGDVKRAHIEELEFLRKVLLKNKVEDRFRSYLKGKKSLPTRKWK